jgi:hypothetical protein
LPTKQFSSEDTDQVSQKFEVLHISEETTGMGKEVQLFVELPMKRPYPAIELFTKREEESCVAFLGQLL